MIFSFVLGASESGSPTCLNARHACGGPGHPDNFQTAGSERSRKQWLPTSCCKKKTKYSS